MKPNTEMAIGRAERGGVEVEKRSPEAVRALAAAREAFRAGRRAIEDAAQAAEWADFRANAALVTVKEAQEAAADAAAEKAYEYEEPYSYEIEAAHVAAREAARVEESAKWDSRVAEALRLRDSAQAESLAASNAAEAWQRAAGIPQGE